MTSKATTPKLDVVDYSTCSFEVRLTKRGILSSSLRYVYFAPDKMIVCKEPYQKKPECVVTMHARFSVKWLFLDAKSNSPFKDRVTGFMILNEQEEIVAEFYGKAMALVPLQEFFSKELFQIDFMKEYEPISKIGKGKYAKVYRVKRKDSGELFAVKYLTKRKMKDIDDSEAALDNELHILRALDHPNCLRMIACYQDSVGYYILTEILDEKKTILEEATKNKNPLEFQQATKSIVSQLLKGLEYIHAKGIMHRDLKPQNIMFTQTRVGQESQLKLIDFGLAQLVSHKKYIYVHVGTPGYVAPEILANESDSHRYDEKCDLFSIGVIFHTLLTGKPVFPGTKFSQVLEKNKQCQVQLTGPRYEELKPDALDLLGRLLQKDPRRRISASDALLHPYFSEKTNGIEQHRIEKMPSTFSDAELVFSPIQLKTHKDQLNGAGTAHRQMRSDQLNYQRNSLVDLLSSLTPMKDIDPTTVIASLVSSQVDSIFRFTKDLLSLLSSIEESKSNEKSDSDLPLKFKQQLDYTPQKMQKEDATATSTHKETRLNLIRFDSASDELVKPQATQSKENSSASPNKNEEGQNEQKDQQRLKPLQLPLKIDTQLAKDKSGRTLDTELTNRKDYRSKISMEQATQNNPCEEDYDQNENDDDDDDPPFDASNNFNQHLDFEKKRPVEQQQPPQQSQKPEPSQQQKSHFAMKNMILNEMSSPESPPMDYNQPQARPPLRLRIEKVPFTPGTPQRVQPSPLVSEMNSSIMVGGTISALGIRNQREISLLIDRFPSPDMMFSCYHPINIEEIEKGMAMRVYKIGVFLVLGSEKLKSKLPESDEILVHLNAIVSKKVFKAEFIEMIKSMLHTNANQRPSIRQLNQLMQTNFP